MTDTLTQAIVRLPAANFEQGLTSVDSGRPDFAVATAQHASYCAALRRCGLELSWLDADSTFPDSTFVEDTAVLTRASAILTRPGATSRRGEVASVEPALRQFRGHIDAIVAPATLDGGDVCAAGDHFFIGISARSNEVGARQLTEFLARDGYTSSTVDIRGIDSILHLKSGVSFLDGNRLVLIDALREHPAFAGYDSVPVSGDEEYGANLLCINGQVIMSTGFARLEVSLRDLGYEPITLDMSEFRKMDGALTCLSLRFRRAGNP